MKPLIHFAPAFFFVALSYSQSLAAQSQFAEVFTLEGLFNMPESAVIDEASEYIYVSNVNVYAKDANGFISRISIDGNERQLQWLQGLDSPTGLAIHADRLFLADYDQLVEVDLTSAEIVNRYPSPDTDPVLNDVAIATDGTVFVSGSGSRSIYRLVDGALEVWLHDRERLAFANGLLVAGNQLLHGGQLWTVFDINTKTATESLASVNAVIGDIDGITSDGCGGYYVTTIPSDDPWQITEAGTSAVSGLGPINGIDLHRRGNLLAVPRVGDSLSLYTIDLDCD
ncbi:MAG: hypothetical protein MI746_07165 [Pseudomonadales bacterium]|nr:hypothetical protein [Pseudomonadales bacterium]